MSSNLIPRSIFRVVDAAPCAAISSEPGLALRLRISPRSGNPRTERASKRCCKLKTMPKRGTRLLLIFALALAVPVQGVAAVSAGLCMALGHHGSAAVHVHDDEGNMSSHDHHHAAGDQHSNGPGSDPAEQGTHCPPCVSCCAAATIAPYQPIFIPERQASSVVTALPAQFSGVLPETLDRPPLAL